MMRALLMASLLLAGSPVAAEAAVATARAPVAWFEIPVTDVSRAKKFYGTVFGWTFTAFPAYGHDCWRIKTGTPGLEGVFTPQLYTVKTNGPILFMRVRDVETALTRVVALGGRIDRTRAAVKGFGSTVVVWDTDKNAIGILGPAPADR